jgi:hypothetical protein
MSAPDPPPDNSMAIRQMEIEEARRKEEQEKKEKEARRQELSGLRSSSRSAASGQVRNYFSGRGVDPEQYGGQIESELDTILGGIAPEDENPGQFFRDAGSTIYGNLETGRRTRVNDQLDTLFGQNYDTRRIPFTLDDPYLSSIENQQYQDADSIIRNMMDRGVLTGTGANTARRDLDNQRSSVRSRLNEIGTGVLTSGQQRLRDIANNARETASTVRLGQDFDPYSYSREADSVFDEFINTLGDQIRGRVTGPLFTTAGLAAIGGAGQGAGNTAFDPDAANGIFDDEDDDDTNASTGTIF